LEPERRLLPSNSLCRQQRIRDPARLATDFDLVSWQEAACRDRWVPAQLLGAWLCPTPRKPPLASLGSNLGNRNAPKATLPSICPPHPISRSHPPLQVVTTYATLGSDFGGKKNGGTRPNFPPLGSIKWHRLGEFGWVVRSSLGVWQWCLRALI